MAKLDNEVAGYKEEIATAESKYHQVNCQLKLVDVNIKRVTQVHTFSIKLAIVLAQFAMRLCMWLSETVSGLGWCVGRRQPQPP